MKKVVPPEDNNQCLETNERGKFASVAFQLDLSDVLFRFYITGLDCFEPAVSSWEIESILYGPALARRMDAPTTVCYGK